MLRWLVLGLLVANLVALAWTVEPLRLALGLPQPGSQREPERLARQVRPDAIQLLPPSARATAPNKAPPAVGAAVGASASTASALPPAECLEIGPLSDEQLEPLTRGLQALGVRSDRWLDIRREKPGRWAVYMGRFSDAEQLQRKLDELNRLRLPYEELVGHASLSPGLTLGQFAIEADAQRKLNQLQARGVRTARVAQLSAPAVEHRLRLDTADAAQALQARELGSSSGLPAWRACEPVGTGR